MSLESEYPSSAHDFQPTMTTPSTSQPQPQPTQLHQQPRPPTMPYPGQMYPSPSSYSNIPSSSHGNWQMTSLHQQYAPQPLHPPAQPFTYTQSFSQGYPNVPFAWSAHQGQAMGRPLASGLAAAPGLSTSPRQSHAQLPSAHGPSSHTFYQALSGGSESSAGPNMQAGPSNSGGAPGGRGGAGDSQSFQNPSPAQAIPPPVNFDFMHSFGPGSFAAPQSMPTSSYSAGYNTVRSLGSIAHAPQGPPPTPTLTGLPPHILHYISVSLASIDILHLSLTCKKMHGTWNDMFWRTWSEQERTPCPLDASPIKHFFPSIISQCDRCGGVADRPSMQIFTRPILRVCEPCYYQGIHELSYVNKTRAVSEIKVKRGLLETIPYLSQGSQKLYLVKDLLNAKVEAEGGADEERFVIQATGRRFFFSDPTKRGPPTQKGLLTLHIPVDDGDDDDEEGSSFQSKVTIPSPQPTRKAKVERTPSAVPTSTQSPAASATSSTGRRRRSTASSTSAPKRPPRSSKSPSESSVARSKEISDIMRDTRKQQLVEALDKEGFMVTEETQVMRHWISGDHLALRALNISTIEDLVKHLLDTFWAHHRAKSAQVVASSTAASAPDTAAAAAPPAAAGEKHSLPAPSEGQPNGKRVKASLSPPSSPRLTNLDEFIDHAEASMDPSKPTQESEPSREGAKASPESSGAQGGTRTERDDDADDEDEPDSNAEGTTSGRRGEGSALAEEAGSTSGAADAQVAMET